MASQHMDAAMVIFAEKVQPSLEEIGRQAVVAGGTTDPRPGVGFGRLLRQVRAQQPGDRSYCC